MTAKDARTMSAKSPSVLDVDVGSSVVYRPRPNSIGISIDNIKSNSGIGREIRNQRGTDDGGDVAGGRCVCSVV